MPTDVYTDPDFIAALYEDPASEVLQAEIAMQTGAAAALLQQQQNASSGGAATGGSGVLIIGDIRGQGGPRRISPDDIS
jgi:hypothetical protein